MPKVSVSCSICSKEFKVNPSVIARGSGKYCSWPCMYAGKRSDPEKRFWSKVAKSDGCWLWTDRPLAPYGRMSLPGGGIETAHRLSWIFTHGDIPGGLSVLHKCDNPPCVRPDHLFLGTHADNMRDAKQKGRYAKGSRQGCHKLTEDQIPEIRRLLASGKSGMSIAAQFGVSKTTIQHIDHGKIWAHVKGAMKASE